jgi:hypothetical protein
MGHAHAKNKQPHGREIKATKRTNNQSPKRPKTQATNHTNNQTT